MDYCFDRTGFPYVALEDPALDVSLLPLTKLQFEPYLADLTPPGDRWYEEVLALNPRVSPQRVAPEQRERLFLTGLLPMEADDYAAWLGEDYRLPTVEEWRAIYERFASISAQDYRCGDSSGQLSDRALQNQPRLGAVGAGNATEARTGLPESPCRKKVIRFFVSYSHKDKVQKNELLERLKDCLDAAPYYEFELWDDGDILPGDHWHRQIQQAVADCHFGLLLVSPAFLGSPYIKDHELPAFVAAKPGDPEPQKRVIPVALKGIIPASMALMGLERLQVFYYPEANDFLNNHFLACNDELQKTNFALALYERIDKIFKRDGPPSAGGPLDENARQPLDGGPRTHGKDTIAEALVPPATSPAPRVAALLSRLEEQIKPQSLLDLSLMRGGLVEWVRDDREDTWRGMGTPRRVFKPNLWNPFCEPVFPLDLITRRAFFGARLVRDNSRIARPRR